MSGFFFDMAPDCERPALVGLHGALTQRELLRAAGSHLNRLREAGVRPGSRIGVFADPSLSVPVAFVAHALGGYVSVPLNPKLGASELAHVLEDAKPVLVVGGEPAARTDAASFHGRRYDYLQARIELAGPPAAVAHRGDCPALILYTSGTTGRPKGVPISWDALSTNLDALAEVWAWTQADTVVHALPLFHVHGLVLGLFGALRVGGALQWLSSFEPRAIAKALSAARSGLLFAVPTMVRRLAQAGEVDASVRHGLASARLLVSGSAGLPLREHRRMEAVAGQGVYERYGLTETLINCAVPTSGPPRPGWVGPPLPGVELRLVDDHRTPLSSAAEAGGALGEVAVRGPQVFSGYLDRPEASEAVMDADGFFHTGDLAKRGPDGSVCIVGRRSTDLIKTGGYKVGAGEVEQSLLAHPAVSEVAVLGAPDDDLGQRIEAFVVLARGVSVKESALIDHVAADLSPHKRPRRVHFRKALPRNAMGKVQKGNLA